MTDREADGNAAARRTVVVRRLSPDSADMFLAGVGLEGGGRRRSREGEGSSQQQQQQQQQSRRLSPWSLFASGRGGDEGGLRGSGSSNGGGARRGSRGILGGSGSRSSGSRTRGSASGASIFDASFGVLEHFANFGFDDEAQGQRRQQPNLAPAAASYDRDEGSDEEAQRAIAEESVRGHVGGAPHRGSVSKKDESASAKVNTGGKDDGGSLAAHQEEAAASEMRRKSDGDTDDEQPSEPFDAKPTPCRFVSMNFLPTWSSGGLLSFRSSSSDADDNDGEGGPDQRNEDSATTSDRQARDLSRSVRSAPAAVQGGGRSAYRANPWRSARAGVDRASLTGSLGSSINSWRTARGASGAVDPRTSSLAGSFGFGSSSINSSLILSSSVAANANKQPTLSEADSAWSVVEAELEAVGSCSSAAAIGADDLRRLSVWEDDDSFEQWKEEVRRRRSRLFLVVATLGIVAAGCGAIGLVHQSEKGAFGGGNRGQGETATASASISSSAVTGNDSEARNRPEPPPIPPDLLEACSSFGGASSSSTDAGERRMGSSAYESCRSMCEGAECCYLPPDHALSCVEHETEEGEDPCSVYIQACSALDATGVDEGDPVVFEEEKQEAVGTMSPPPPHPDPDVLHARCSLSAVRSASGYSKCWDLCEGAMCCFEDDEDEDGDGDDSAIALFLEARSAAAVDPTSGLREGDGIDGGGAGEHEAKGPDPCRNDCGLFEPCRSLLYQPGRTSTGGGDGDYSRGERADDVYVVDELGDEGAWEEESGIEGGDV